MNSETYLIIILVIIAADLLVTLTIFTLDYNYKKTPPRQPTINKDYVKSKRYLRTNIKLGLVKVAVDTTFIITVILTGILNNLDLAVRALGYGPIITGILFFGAMGLALFSIGIPFSIIKTFYIEKKYNFNKTTKKIFIADLIKTGLGWIIVGGVGLFIILTFFEKAGALAWIYCWAAMTVVQIFTMFIYPVFILPIYNKLMILNDGQLKEMIKEYLDKHNIDIKMDNIRVIDSSKRTSKSSAFLCGFGKNKRLVLFDTLLKNHTHDEILAVVAHEIGHLKMNHLPKKLILYVGETFLMMFLLSYVIQNSNFFMAFGVENTSVYLGLMLFSIIYSPIALLFSTLTNHLSKKYEYDADEYAAATTSAEAMASTLSKLGSHNLTNPTPHSVTVFLKYTHPPIKDRIERILK